eukprot:2658168-Prymnesium_polylepis.1
MRELPKWQIGPVVRGGELELLCSEMAVEPAKAHHKAGKGKVASVARLQQRVHADTVVRYADEKGEDWGALTACFFSSFWAQAFAPAAGLFEAAPSSEDGEGGKHRGKLLPAAPRDGATAEEAEAHYERLRRVGHVLLKCLVWEHPTGPQLATFAFAHLLDEARPLYQPGGPLATAEAAVAALAETEPQ